MELWGPMLTAVVLRQCFAVSVFFLFSFVCHASELGRVSVAGSIFESSCSIDMASKKQLVVMKTVSVGQLMHDGEAGSTLLRIHLVGCSTQLDSRRFYITFNGSKDDRETFHVFGNTQGVGIRITDANGVRIKPGEPSYINQSMAKLNTLDYTLTLTGNGEILHPGFYATVVRMSLDYF